MALSRAALSSPRTLLSALEAEAGRRLPLSVGGAAADLQVHQDPLLAAWLLPGAVVELSALPGGGGLSVALALAKGARAQARATSRSAAHGVGVIDGPGTLCAPALAHALGAGADHGVLDETVVVRPAFDDANDAAVLLTLGLRLCRSGACAAVVIDAGAVTSLCGLVGPARRLLRAAEDTGTAVVVITAQAARRDLPLPAAARALVERERGAQDGDSDVVVVRAVRHRHGLPPRLRLPRRRLSMSVVDDLVAELDAELDAKLDGRHDDKRAHNDDDARARASAMAGPW